MKVWQLFKESNSLFKLNWSKYVNLFVEISLLIDILVTAIFIFFGNLILNKYQVGFISYKNFVSLWLDKPILMVGILGLLVTALLLVYFKFVFVIIGVYRITDNESSRFTNILKYTIKSILKLRSAFWVFMLYFISFAPIVGLGIRIDLLGRLRFSNNLFVMMFSDKVGLLFLIIYLTIFYLSLRFIYVFPNVLWKNMSVKQAIHSSFTETKEKQLQILLTILLAFILVEIVLAILFLIMYLLQIGLDNFKFSDYFAGFNISLITTGILFSEIYLATVIFILAIKNDVRPKKIQLTTNRIGSLLVASLTVLYLVSGTFYYQHVINDHPLVISHRGLNRDDGVQNTIPALDRTSKIKPDYVEMDVQETKDNQFVVFHDETLGNLAGINKHAQQFTLKQLKQITVRDDNHTAKIAGFDDYYRAAKRHHQKLLIELKFTNMTSPQFATNFMKRYGKVIKNDHQMMHSMEYEAIEVINTYQPKICASDIMAFNFLGVPLNRADAFTMEYVMLNNSFVMQSHLKGKRVFAWTVDNTNDMKKMYFLDADAMITNQPQLLQKTLKKNETSYATKLRNYMLAVQFPIR